MKTNIKLKCPICYNTSKIVLEDRYLNVYRCKSCSHTFTVILKEEQEKYNEGYYTKEYRNWFKYPNYKLFNFIYNKSTQLLDKKPFQLLDVGCGKGDLLKYIASKDLKANLFGIDLIDNSDPRIHFIKGDFLEEKIESKFNVICSIAVVEHIDNPHLFLQKIRDLIEPNGLLFITTVNNNSLLYRISRLLKKLGIRVAYNRLYFHHHLQHYTNQSLRKLMEMNNFDILLQKNHNYSIKMIDVPESSFLIKNIYKLSVYFIFLLSSSFNSGMLQTIVCKKKNN